MKPLNIVFASSEVTPFAKTGGLADVSSSLPSAMASQGHQVQIIMPMYRSVIEGNFKLKLMESSLEIPYRGQLLKAKVYHSKIGANLLIYFIRRDEFFDRSGLYRLPEGDYFDNPDRFIFFSRAVLHVTKLIGFQPDIIHCNDWQTSLIPVYLKSLYNDDPFFRFTRTIFTIHNLAYQGVFPKEYMDVSGLPWELFSIKGIEYYGKMNFMKGGIMLADIISTVSERYAQEIRTPEFGYGLDGVLRDRSADIYGVLNGVDYSEWNPETDPHIAANYSAKDLSGKQKCKEALMKILNLKGSQHYPIIGMITRLADQKGCDLLAEAIDELMKLELFLVLLGQGEEKYEKRFLEEGKKHRGRFGVKIAFDGVLAHHIEAGADMFLMPSRYEPCGLNQMYSLKYGTIPIVRATGGLDDTIKEFDPETEKGNGFKFAEYSSKALIEKIKKALVVYQNKELWLKLVKNAMKEDFSWERSALKYQEIYYQALSKV
ncbi:MAG: glycogen synthase GlgA [Candidatus Aminicenantes bacterium]|nr:glycogen synthase GlgA [Candidatus Aminicenantes bacterium]